MVQHQDPPHPQDPQHRWSLTPVPGLPEPPLAPEDLAAPAAPRELWLEALHTKVTSRGFKGCKKSKMEL